MTKFAANQPCPCGSGFKFKKCCANVRFEMAPGVTDLVRPKNVPVEETFNKFVEDFGGELISASMSKTDTGQNADYFFPDDNVVAELKSFEKDLFNSLDDVERIGRIIQKHNKIVSGSESLRWLFGAGPIPVQYRRDMLSLARRRIENSIRKASKQLQESKKWLKCPDARGLILLANDGNYFSNPAEAISLVCQVMTEHFNKPPIDAFVYFTMNVVAKDPRTERELIIWVPVYRDEGSGFSEFVNRLGSAWGQFYETLIGQEMSHFKTDDARIVKMMRFVRPPGDK